MLEHGGRLLAAARRYGIPPGDWLDLSAALNPAPWPVPALPAAAWHALPQEEDGLAALAAAHYGAPHALPVAGTQAAIQALPRLLRARRIGVLAPTYAEYAHAFAASGAQVLAAPWPELLREASTFDAMFICNPNNPDGKTIPPEELRWAYNKLAARGGTLIVDEAFADCTPDFSLATDSARDGLIVLRSLGKFFGLAGARVGFVLAARNVLDTLTEALGPWCVSTPARLIAAAALRDTGWQAQARETLPLASARLARMLAAHGLTPQGGCALFQWVPHAHAARLYSLLARRAILTRLFDAPGALRFGLPTNEAAWARLDAALAEATSEDAVHD